MLVHLQPYQTLTIGEIPATQQKLTLHINISFISMKKLQKGETFEVK